MAKFNQTNTIKTTNKCGHIAYSMKDKEKLVTQVLTSFFGEQKYYGDNTNELKETATKVVMREPKFVANLARYARKEMHLRSVSHYLTALIANSEQSKQYIKQVVSDVVERVDDITEILSCYLSEFGKPIPNGLKKALATAMNRFDEYQMSKYNGGNKQVKLKDVLRITHAKPKDERQSQIFKAILDDNLATAERWETELSANGNNATSWAKLIANDKIGYMAALRNLRNIINAQPINIDKIYNMLEDKERVLKSKQLPFRFYSAYKELQYMSNSSSKVFDVLENAIEYSIENMPKIKGTTVIAIDVSGSMGSYISGKSTIGCGEIASLLGAMANKICENAIVYTFDTSIRKFAFSKRNGILQTAKQLNYNGGGTDITLPLKEMINNNIIADRLIILSDNEINSGWSGGYEVVCQSYADKYRKTINKDLWVHAIDLQGYGTQQFIGKNTNIIAGWNEKVFEFINIAESGIGNQVERIENYE